MTSLMQKWSLPGGQLSVAKNGRLVFNRGFGLADVEHDVPVQPDNLFRIASVTKTITAVAIMTLVDTGKLNLDDKVFPLLGFEPASHASVDPRLRHNHRQGVSCSLRWLGLDNELRSPVLALEPHGGGDVGLKRSS